MSWTTPTTRATGDLITASIWNTDLTNNLIYLYNQIFHVVGVTTTPVANSGTSQTTCWTLNIPAGTLGTNNILPLSLAFNWVAGTGDITPRIKYGGTTMATPTITTSNDGQTRRAILELYLTGDGATNAQRLGGLLFDGGGTFIGQACTGTAAEDSTLDKNLVITLQVAGTSTFLFKMGLLRGPYLP